MSQVISSSLNQISYFKQLVVLHFIFGKGLLSLLFTPIIPTFLFLLFPYFSVDWHLKAWDHMHYKYNKFIRNVIGSILNLCGFPMCILNRNVIWFDLCGDLWVIRCVLWMFYCWCVWFIQYINHIYRIRPDTWTYQRKLSNFLDSLHYMNIR